MGQKDDLSHLVKVSAGCRPEPAVIRARRVRCAEPRQLCRGGQSGQSLLLEAKPRMRKRKKTGVVEGHQILNHAGLLFDGPPGISGLPFV